MYDDLSKHTYCANSTIFFDFFSKGVMTYERAEDLKRLPLQDTDLLLHESGIPPIHTPIQILMSLPQRVKDRLYVVHTGSLPENCELRIAPVGTQNSIRLDENHFISNAIEEGPPSIETLAETLNTISENHPSHFDEYADYNSSQNHAPRRTSHAMRTSLMMRPSFSTSSLGLFDDLEERAPPRVAMRPTSSTDAWFMLNLLSTVPFLSRFVLL